MLWDSFLHPPRHRGRGTSLRLLCRVSDSPFSEVEVKAFAFTLKPLIESEIVGFDEW